MDKTTVVSIKGTSALLMHRFPMEPIEAIEKKSAEVQAEFAAYRMESNGKPGNLYLPGIAVQRALVNGATYVKGKGRGSLQKNAAACLMVRPEYIDLGTSKYAIDSRAVVVPATKGRIIRYRPRIDDWEVSFHLDWDDALLSEKQLREIVDATCSRVGFLDFRPERKGPFGRAMVVSWEASI